MEPTNQTTEPTPSITNKLNELLPPKAGISEQERQDLLNKFMDQHYSG